MKTSLFAALTVAVVLAAGGVFYANAQQAKPGAIAPHEDPRLDKIIQQQEQILKNQEEMKKTLELLRQDIFQVRRRSS